MESEDLDYIKNQETYFILLYGRKDQKKGSLVNLTDGGELNNEQANGYRRNYTVTESTRKQMSLSKLGKMRGDKNPKSKSVIHLESKIVYGSLLDACRRLGLENYDFHKYAVKVGKEYRQFDYYKNKTQPPTFN